MDISIIIPTRNRARLLEATLDSIGKQTFPKDRLEVIVVDNGSTDATLQICDAFKVRFPNFKYIYAHDPGLHVGRHAGLQSAKADLLVFGDDDIEAFPSWISAIYESFQDSQVAMVGGKNLPKFEKSPPHWLWEKWVQPHPLGKVLGYLSILDLGENAKEIDPFLIYGCNFAIRKEVLLEAGGFHPDGMPQELIQYRGDGESHVSGFVHTKNYKAFYHPKASVYHWVSASRMTEDYFCKRAFNQGISDSYAAIRKNGLPTEITQTESNSLIGRIIRFGEKIINNNLLRRDIIRIENMLLENPLDKKTRISKQRGIDFHQHAVRNDPALLQWIQSPTYLDLSNKSDYDTANHPQRPIARNHHSS